MVGESLTPGYLETLGWVGEEWRVGVTDEIVRLQLRHR